MCVQEKAVEFSCDKKFCTYEIVYSKKVKFLKCSYNKIFLHIMPQFCDRQKLKICLDIKISVLMRFQMCIQKNMKLSN